LSRRPRLRLARRTPPATVPDTLEAVGEMPDDRDLELGRRMAASSRDRETPEVVQGQDRRKKPVAVGLLTPASQVAISTVAGSPPKSWDFRQVESL
jgi:hypothetical protein